MTRTPTMWRVVETALDIPRTWVEFDNPDDPEERFRCDLTWLTSSWTCIFGNGCQGIYEEAPDVGCCTLGAHFSDKDDLKNVKAAVRELGPDEWQYYDEGHSKDGWREKEDGDWKTRVVDGACIFHNRPGFPAGAGCALHQHAILTGVPPHTIKPDVCWQLPMRRTYRTVEQPDDTSYLEISIGEYDRRGWGPGGHDLDWYCSGNPEAHVGSSPVYVSNEGELRHLMGDNAYAELARRCEAHLVQATALRHAGPAGRELLPLYVHPATLLAEEAAEEASSAKSSKRKRK
ncbi:hypothetical protein GCM10011492_36840 [Flexivirga endophytica]|uniref:DUF3109 family protein n=1 Tax=Flexivirga endophytica TaxID=1849103 RepID=A0A916WZW7_9MICO|nr:hypothetical protein GCM10011492_36840 [Flexivirga endophytica]GHB64060.1 hypothetical protein GCM10008112_36190 [Flexivirga endophytica]